MTDACPRCGAPGAGPSSAGPCPRCPEDLATGPSPGAFESIPTRFPGSVLDSLARSLGPMPRVLLPESLAGEASSPVVHPSSAEMPGPADRTTKVQLLGEIARGGMGVVLLKGRDPDLGRDLAVKVLLDAHRDKPELVRRFVEEAQIGGQLQHPGVVPVYELGTFGDSRPLFHHEAGQGPDPGRDPGRADPGRSTTGRGSWRSSSRSLRRSPTPTPGG